MYLLNLELNHTNSGDTSMMRIQWTGLTVKALHKRLQQAYTAGDKRLVRRLSVLLAVGQHKAKITEVAQQWGIGFNCVDIVKSRAWSARFTPARPARKQNRWFVLVSIAAAPSAYAAKSAARHGRRTPAVGRCPLKKKP